MTLSSKQAKFTQMIIILYLVAAVLGYRVRDGHAYRCSNCHQGNKLSLHKDRLARDLIIDMKIHNRWVYQRDDRNGCYSKLGQFWKLLGGTFGGDWGDFNHFSLAYGGRK